MVCEVRGLQSQASAPVLIYFTPHTPFVSCPALLGADPFSDDPFFGSGRRHQSRANRSHRTGGSFFGGFVGFPPFGAGFTPFDPGEMCTSEYIKKLWNTQAEKSHSVCKPPV